MRILETKPSLLPELILLLLKSVGEYREQDRILEYIVPHDSVGLSCSLVQAEGNHLVPSRGDSGWS